MNRSQPRRHLRWLAPRKRRRRPLAGLASNIVSGLQSCGARMRTEERRTPLDTGSAALAALLAGVADDDAGAFAALYDRTCSRLYGVAFRVLRDRTAAQEATHEAYLQAWATAESFDPTKGSVEAWLTTLMHRVAVDRLRAEPCRAARILGCSNGNRVGGCHYVIDEVRHHTVSVGSDVLNDWERETIALAYYGALTYQEVAEFLGVPLSTVTSRVRAGLTRLAQSAGAV